MARISSSSPPHMSQLRSIYCIILLPTMASERFNLTPVPSVARIIQLANKDTALFFLQSVLKTGAHLPAGKWTNLVKLLWD